MRKERKIQLFGGNTLSFFLDLSFQKMILEKIYSPVDQLFVSDEEGLLHDQLTGLHIPPLNGLLTLVLPLDLYVKLNESYPEAISIIQNLRLRPCVYEEIEAERIVPFLPRVTRSSEFTRLQSLPNVITFHPSIQELFFEQCGRLETLSSPLPNLCVLKLSESYVCNLNDFNHLKELQVEGESQLSVMTNYSALSTAKKLILLESESLTDISFLQENEDVTVYGCSQVVNYCNCFQKSKRISINFSYDSAELDVDLSYYSQVEKLELMGYELFLENGLARGNIPPSLQHLYLVGVRNIRNLIGFEHLKTVSLLSCDDITTLEGLEHVPSIHLYNLPIASLEGLGGNKEVSINLRCKGFTDASHLEHVSHVSLTSCDYIEDVSALRNAETVELFFCPLIKTVEGLKGVKKLRVQN